LARWWRAYNGDIKMIERKMHQLFEHRRVIGYDRLDTKLFDVELDFARRTFELLTAINRRLSINSLNLQNREGHEITRLLNFTRWILSIINSDFQRFSISSLSQDHFSGNVCIFLQKMAGTDLKEIMKVIPLSYVIHSYFMLLESFTRAVLTKEKQTGTCAAAVIVLDLEGLNITDFLNPLSTPARLARLVVKVWSEYFSETIIKVYIVNSPALLSVMWQVTKLIMDKKTQSRITFLDKPSDLLEHLSAKSVPECYGGARRDDSGYADPPESACKRALQVTPQHYYDVNKLWREHGFERLPSRITTIAIKGNEYVEVIR
uniref:CRAL-TRIO domain-containing protein n=1 Tax=Anisakis simplex TaxID=6269 RepID=A0A0M3J3K6_ANISI